MNTIVYDDLLLDKGSIIQELYCTICSNIIMNAHQCSQGGHLFCEHCIKEWLKTQTTCPSCRCLISYDTLSKNRLANNLIGNLKIHCPNLKDGCNDIICIEQLESHLHVCQQRLINCPQGKQCGFIRLNKLNEHLESCRYNYLNNCLYRSDNEKKIIKEMKLELQLSNNNNCNNNSLSNETSDHSYEQFNLDYINQLHMKLNEIELTEQQSTIKYLDNKVVGDNSNLNDDINHGFDWIIQNYNDKVKMMGEDGYMEIIPFEHLIIRFYPNKTEYFTTPCKPGVQPMEIMCIKLISKCLIPLELKLTIQSPISREVKSILRKDLDLDIKFDKINDIKNDLKLSFIVNLKKKYLNLFTS